MQRCLQLAQNGLGTTYPNPLVGSVIVHNQKIIGEGWHKKAGEPHAEIVAINSVKNKELLKEATLYVNLEPCSHFGKTPPCSHRIVELGIPKVVIGCRDYASHVNGKGIEYLKSHKVEVIEGVLEKEATELNKRFFTFHQKKRPYIILKWAETKNGFFAPKNNEQKWITNTYTKQLVHKWRTEEQAILIGKNTAKIDNPQLNARLWKGNNPTKVIIDKNLELPLDLNIFNNGKTLIFNSLKKETVNNLQFIQINFEENMLPELLHQLHENNIQSIIIEGGAFTLNQFIQQNLWDEARILVGNTSWKDGIKAPELKNSKIILSEQQIQHNTIFKIENRALPN